MGSTAIRPFFFLLVLANLLFFAWTQGYFGTADENREPLRIRQQLHADKLRILGEAPNAPAKKDDKICRVINGLTAADSEALKTRLAAVGAEMLITLLAEPKLHVIVIPELANKAAADRKSAELGRFGVSGHTIVGLEGGHYEIVLASFATGAEANEALQRLNKRGIKSARLDAREPPPAKAAVEVRAAASMLLPQLPVLIAPFADATVGECPAREQVAN